MALARSRADGPPASPPRLRFLVLYLVLLAGVALAYQPAWHGGFLWDDDANVTSPELHSAHGLWRIWTEVGATQQYYPLLHSAFWVEHRLWGDSTTGYHVVNIVLHALSAAMLALILRRLAVPGALLAAGIFAVHPVFVESVAWITQQKNMLSGVLFMGTVLLYLRFDATRRAGAWVAALSVFVLALLAKTSTVPLPGVLLVTLWWMRGRLSWRRDVLPMLPFIVVALAAGLFTAWVEQRFVGAAGAAFDLTLAQRFLIAGRDAWFYLGKLIWPAGLVFIYPRWDVNEAVGLQVLCTAGVLALLAVAFAMRRRRRWPLAVALLFLGTLSPVLGFCNQFAFLYSWVADHWVYLPSLGVIALASAGIATLLQRWRLWGRPAGIASCLALLVLLGGLTFRQCRLYADIETLYRATLADNPSCWMAHNNLGIVLADSARVPEAIEHYEEALRLRPDYPEAELNWGVALVRAGRLAEALPHYEAALRLRPGSSEAHANLANALVKLGRIPEAIDHYRESLRLRPDQAELRNNLGILMVETGNLAQAIEEFRESLRLRPESAETHNNLGTALLRSERLPEAMLEFETALRLNPEYGKAHVNLGNALVKAGRVPEAIEHYRRALQIRPDDAAARAALAAAEQLLPPR